MASWAEISGWVPSIAVDIPAGVEADTGDLPLLRGEHGDRRRPPTVTVALGALRQAHVTAHCGQVLLARCGLTVDHDFNARFNRLIDPDLGFDVPETVNPMVMDLGEPLADSWRHVRRASICVVIGGIDCLGFGNLALRALRGPAPGTSSACWRSGLSPPTAPTTTTPGSSTASMTTPWYRSGGYRESRR